MIAVLRSTWALLLGMFMLMIGNGMQGSLLGLRGHQEGFTTFQLSIVMSAYFAGFLFASRVAPMLIQRVGHIRVFSALGLGSSFCFLVFVGIWFWYRSSVRRTHDECRRAITKMLETRLNPTARTFYPVLVEDPQLKVDEGRASKLPKAS